MPFSRRCCWQCPAPCCSSACLASLVALARSSFAASFEHLESLIAREKLDAAYTRCGRLLLACNPRHFRKLQDQVLALGEAVREHLRAGARVGECDAGGDDDVGAEFVDRVDGAIEILEGAGFSAMTDMDQAVERAVSLATGAAQ